MHLSTSSMPLVRPTSKSHHVLVVGAGVIGLTTAWTLLDRGYKVTILAENTATYGHGERIASQIAGAL
jgi:D-amino-acid oxidase